MKVKVLVITKDGSAFEKEREIPFAPYPGTVLRLKIGDRYHPLVVTKLEWDEERNTITAWMNGSKLSDSSYYLRKEPNFYFEKDQTWIRNH